MSQAGSAKSNRPEGWGVQPSTPQPTPLAIVSSAVAGDDIERVARSASDALAHPVVIILPALGAPAVWPPEAVRAGLLDVLVAYAVAVAGGTATDRPEEIVHVEPIRIGREVVGIVAAIGGPLTNGAAECPQPDPAHNRAWLEAAAAAAAVTRLMHEGPDGERADLCRALLGELIAGPPGDIHALLTDARRLDVDLAAGAIAVCARATNGLEPELNHLASGDGAALVADVGHGRVLGLVPLAGGSPAGERGAERDAERDAASVAGRLRADGLEVGVSAPRRQPSLLHEAVREAMLLAELACGPDAAVAGQEETYRLLIGVLLRDRQEVELLRARTISPLLAYDAQHDTELLATLATFLAHHGSTTETAEAMQLHRHTVGYRLSRVQEVSGLSPYESDGRERLSLGLKAAQILAAEGRLSQPG
jgi:PucR C-terminal helix-turn-helix domain